MMETSHCTVCGQAATPDVDKRPRVWARGLCYDCSKTEDLKDHAEFEKHLSVLSLEDRLKLLESHVYKPDYIRRVLRRIRDSKNT